MGVHCIGFPNVTHLFSVQNGSVHQKDGLNDDDFEPYLSPQARPVSTCCRQEHQEPDGFLLLQGKGIWPPCVFPISTDYFLMFALNYIVSYTCISAGRKHWLPLDCGGWSRKVFNNFLRLWELPRVDVQLFFFSNATVSESPFLLFQF